MVEHVLSMFPTEPDIDRYAITFLQKVDKSSGLRHVIFERGAMPSIMAALRWYAVELVEDNDMGVYMDITDTILEVIVDASMDEYATVRRDAAEGGVVGAVLRIMGTWPGDLRRVHKCMQVLHCMLGVTSVVGNRPDAYRILLDAFKLFTAASDFGATVVTVRVILYTLKTESGARIRHA